MGTQPYNPQQPAARTSWRPLLISTVLLVLLLSLFLRAGFWQLDRAGEKEALLEAIAEASQAETLTSLVSDAEAPAYRFRHFELSGYFEPERQLLLDNMVANGRNGYEVLTPFVTNGQRVLVNRGWVAADVDRNVLPAVPVSQQERTIIGQLQRLPVPGIRIAPPDTDGGSWPRRMLFPTHAQIEAVLGDTVLDYQLRLDAQQPDGYLREWAPLESGPEKHYGYALQWFAFAFLSLVFYLLLNLRGKGPRQSNSGDSELT